MAPNLGQQSSARHIPTHHLFNIFGKLHLIRISAASAAIGSTVERDGRGRE
jgi:hypothetical protein